MYMHVEDLNEESENIDLSPNEQKILKILVENKGDFLDKNYIADEVWPDVTHEQQLVNLATIMFVLRIKLADIDDDTEHIRAVGESGYIWNN